MSQRSSAPTVRVPAEKLVRDISRATRKHHSAQDRGQAILLERQRTKRRTLQHGRLMHQQNAAQPIHQMGQIIR